ncbi:MAG: hypothetical protein ACFCAD_16135 [Pleurocapsa sp.]
MLLSTLDLSQQSWNFTFDPRFAARTIGSKIVLLHSSIESISFDRQIQQVLSTPQSAPFVYRSSIALLLASYTQNTPQFVAEELIDWLVSTIDNRDSQLNLNLCVEIRKSGLIDFYFDHESMAIWLEKSLVLLDIKTNVDLTKSFLGESLKSTPSNLNLFPAQYIHARCCTLLRLGIREKLLFFADEAQAISWLDHQNNLWLREEAELILLRQLCLITDSFRAESSNWQKLALNFSAIIAIFLAECRVIGDTHQRNPQKAIARLRLIALSQYWLQRILVEKLKVVAPTSL